MASSDKKKPSISSQPNTAALVTVAGSELDFYTNSNYLAYELPKYAAALRGSEGGDSGDGGDGGDSGEDGDNGDGSNDGDNGEGGNDPKPKNARPSLSDIEVISNEVVYDSANNPTAKIVFKVKNSSGVQLKAVNVRVEKK
jgi:hypothetical protein